MLAYQMPVGIAGLPAKEKRNELEELSWQAVLEAVKYGKARGLGGPGAAAQMPLLNCSGFDNRYGNDSFQPPPL
jgi:hypothetical protein